MVSRGSAAALIPLLILLLTPSHPTPACCPAGPAGRRVVNADQTVIMVWDAARKMQHFIRQASFRSNATDIGFLIPTPSVPELAESGNEAFPMLARLTAPAVQRVPRPRGGGCACSALPTAQTLEKADVTVLAEKRVAGFDAQVLEAKSADTLVTWLNEHGYEFSAEVAAWAEPYVRDGWKFTALKVAQAADAQEQTKLAASALRISFATERPLFPYREPDPQAAAEQLQAHSRLLRIYFLSDGRYRGDLTPEEPWSGRVAWSDQIKADDRRRVLDALQLPTDTGPADWWLTEFEDDWRYRAAPADVYFARDDRQDVLHRDPILQYVQSSGGVDVSLTLLALACVGPLVWPRLRGRLRR